MKRFLLLIVCVIAVNAMQAQPFGMGGHHGMGPGMGPGNPQMQQDDMTPEKMASRMTARMNERLMLTEKQYKKIYRINMRYSQKVLGVSVGATSMPSDRVEMGGGGRMHRMGPPPPPMGGGNMDAQMKKRWEENEKARNKRFAEYKKVLTAEQYAEFEKMQAEMQQKRMERFGQGRGQGRGRGRGPQGQGGPQGPQGPQGL